MSDQSHKVEEAASGDSSACQEAQNRVLGEHPLVGEAEALLEQGHALYQAFVSFAYRLRQAMEARAVPDEQLADVGFLCRELSELIGEDLRKDAKARGELIGAWLCARAARKAAAGATSVGIRGRLCTATPDVGMRCIPPKRGDPAYDLIMAWMGVGERFVKAGAVGIHYSRMNELLTEMAARGEAAPQGLTAVPTNKVTYRRLRKRDEQSDEREG